MQGFFQKLPSLEGFPLEVYAVDFKLDRLVPGVDNRHYDVHLSPGFCKSTNRVVRHLFNKLADVEQIFGADDASSLAREIDEFKRLCQDVLQGAINKAKSNSEIQIDLLAQIAVVKMLTKVIRSQHKKLIEDLNDVAREYEMSPGQDQNRAVKIKEKLSNIQKNQNSIFLDVGTEIFQHLIEIQCDYLKEMREAIFGLSSNIPDDILTNPILYVKNSFDDRFMIDQYVLLGRRFEDPDNYNTLLLLFRSMLGKILLPSLSSPKIPEPIGKMSDQDDENAPKNNLASDNNKIDAWLKYVDNVDVLFNRFRSEDRYQDLKKQQGAGKELVFLKKQMTRQERLLNFVYKIFNQADLTKRIAAYYEMQSVYLGYCPPLVPHQVLQFLINPKQRKGIVSQLNSLKGFYGKSFSLAPLKKKIKQLKKITTQQKKKYVVQFLNDFARYHKDLQNFKMLSKAMDSLNLTSEDKIINLSRENRTLHEFLLTHEQVLEKKPIVNHVVLKADVRDSTDITNQMKGKGLNPASFFSLNFFDPITEVLFEYAAEKVFIEGDAVILSITEREDTPEGWYAVARACGLAIKMLFIVQQYNVNSRKRQLPILEIGIGICFNSNPPTFLFDGSNRIMISSAINSADRLSSSTKSLHKLISKKKHPFNLYVFQASLQKDRTDKTYREFFRYNVNGIELNPEGFEKLSKEINLKEINFSLPELQKEKVRIYTGKFPTVTGKYQRLIIREAHIPEIIPDNLKVIRPTNQKYYEVCTNPKLYKHLKSLS